MMITRSPGCTRCAAAPLIPMTPDPRSPSMTYVSRRAPLVDVDDVDQLAGQQIGRVEEIGVDGHGSDVVQVGLGDRGAVDLGLEHGAQHEALLLG